MDIDINDVMNGCICGTLALCCSPASKLGVTAELLSTVTRIVSIFAEKKLAKRVASSCMSSFCGKHVDFHRCRRPFIKQYNRLELPMHCSNLDAK